MITAYWADIQWCGNTQNSCTECYIFPKAHSKRKKNQASEVREKASNFITGNCKQLNPTLTVIYLGHCSNMTQDTHINNALQDSKWTGSQCLGLPK